MVTKGEILAFFLSVEIARRSLSNRWVLRSAIGKISAGLKGPITVDIETLKNRYTFAMPAVTVVDDRLLLDMHRAILKNLSTQIHYYTASRGQHTERDVDPYRLYNV